jgi:hypothetical protein
MIPHWVRNLIHDAVLAVVVSACLAALILVLAEFHWIWQHS